MDATVCKKCGSNEFIENSSVRVCVYCRTSYEVPKKDKESNISLHDDVQALLMKCKFDPANARRYATLALEIDPHNKEATRYL